MWFIKYLASVVAMFVGAGLIVLNIWNAIDGFGFNWPMFAVSLVIALVGAVAMTNMEN